MAAAETPTIYEWGGGREVFERWLNHFYDLVEVEGTLAPLRHPPQPGGRRG